MKVHSNVYYKLKYSPFTKFVKIAKIYNSTVTLNLVTFPTLCFAYSEGGPNLYICNKC